MSLKFAESLIRSQPQQDAQRLSQILNQLHAGIASADREGRLFEMNDRYCQLVGRPREALLGMSIIAFTHPDDRAANLELFHRCSSEGVGFTQEKRYVRPDGGIVWVHNSVTLVKGGEAEEDFLTVISVDITGQKAAERALQEREERFRNLADNSPMFVWMTDTGAQVTYANKCLLDYVGIADEASFLDDTWKQVTHPDDIAAVHATYEKALQRPQPFDIEVRFREGATGKYNWFQFKAVPLFEQETFTGFIGTAINIQGFRDAEQASRENLEQLKTIVDAQPHLASIIANDGQTLYYSPSWYTYTGQSVEAAMDEGSTAGFIHPDDLGPVTERWINALQQGLSYETEARLKDKDGRYYWHYLKALPIRDSNGHIKCWISTATDIHRQKIFREELERQVEERTQSLQAANKKLEHSNQELERFAYVASHDLQEPLRKVKSFGDMLKARYSDSLGADGANLIDRMQSASVRMKHLIEDLLSYSRVAAPGKPHEPVDLNLIVSEVLSDLETVIREKGARVAADRLPFVHGNELQLRQLFQNLVSNSLKFTRPGVVPELRIEGQVLTGGDSSIGVLLQDREKSYLQIGVSDNGIGFEPEYAEKIFQIFQRLNGRSEYEGSGIGLSIVQKVVDAHNGYVSAEGRPGAGATFTLLLPEPM